METRPMMPRRHPQNRRASARSFNRNERKRHIYNLSVMRGGWRL